MPEGDATSWLGGWEGYRVETIQRRDDERREIWIFLGRAPCAAMICDGCGQIVDRVHDVETREIRDLPILLTQADSGRYIVIVPSIAIGNALARPMKKMSRVPAV